MEGTLVVVARRSTYQIEDFVVASVGVDVVMR